MSPLHCGNFGERSAEFMMMELKFSMATIEISAAELARKSTAVIVVLSEQISLCDTLYPILIPRECELIYSFIYDPKIVNHLLRCFLTSIIRRRPSAQLRVNCHRFPGTASIKCRSAGRAIHCVPLLNMSMVVWVNVNLKIEAQLIEVGKAIGED